MIRRRVPQSWFFALYALVAWMAPATAADYPARPITLVVPYSAGADAEPLASTPEEYAADIDREETKWSAIVKLSGARAE